jgi:hypothetical protein
MANIPTISPYKGDGTTPLLQKWLEILWGWIKHVTLFGTIKDLTSAASDYSLSINETAKINITAASTPLNIAVSDGWYEIAIVFNQSTFSADRAVSLDPNNTTHTNEMSRSNVLFDVNVATDELDVSEATESTLSVGSASFFSINAKIVIFGNHKEWEWRARGLVTGNRRMFFGNSYWNSSTAWTSLGTLQCVEVVTGICYVTRVA